MFSYNWPISDVVVFEVTLVRLLLLPSIYHKALEQPGWFFACEKKEGKIIQKGSSFKVTAEYTWQSEVNIINLHVILSFHLSVQFCFKENVSSIGNDSPNLLPLWRYIPTMCHFEVTYTDLLCLNIFWRWDILHLRSNLGELAQYLTCQYIKGSIIYWTAVFEVTYRFISSANLDRVFWLLFSRQNCSITLNSYYVLYLRLHLAVLFSVVIDQYWNIRTGLSLPWHQGKLNSIVCTPPPPSPLSAGGRASDQIFKKKGGLDRK